MKYVLWAIVGLVAIVIAFIGVGYYWTTTAKVDFSNPQVAANFKDTFNGNCIARAKKSGVKLSDDQLDQLCTCTRDGVVDALAKRPPMTVMQMADAVSNDPELKQIADTCSAPFGVTVPE